jgi:hypothetical protein
MLHYIHLDEAITQMNYSQLLILGIIYLIYNYLYRLSGSEFIYYPLYRYFGKRGLLHTK